MGEDADLRSLLEALDPKARDDLRRVLIHDQADRNAIASQLLRYRDERGDDWADIIDMLTMHPEARRTVIWLRGEHEAGERRSGLRQDLHAARPLRRVHRAGRRSRPAGCGDSQPYGGGSTGGRRFTRTRGAVPRVRR